MADLKELVEKENNNMCDQLNVLCKLNSVLSRLLSDLEDNFKYLQYRKNERSKRKC